MSALWWNGRCGESELYARSARGTLTMYPPMPPMLPMPPYLPTQDGQQFQGWQTYIPYPTQPPPAPAPTINSIQTAPPLQSLRGTSELNRGTGVQKQYLNIERGHGGK